MTLSGDIRCFTCTTARISSTPEESFGGVRGAWTRPPDELILSGFGSAPIIVVGIYNTLRPDGRIYPCQSDRGKMMAAEAAQMNMAE